MLFGLRLWVCDYYSVWSNVNSSLLLRAVRHWIVCCVWSTFLALLGSYLVFLWLLDVWWYLPGSKMAFCHHESSFSMLRLSSFTSLNSFIVPIPPQRSLQFYLSAMSRPKVVDVHCGLSSGVYSITREPKWSHSALSLVLLCFHGNHVRPRAGPKKTGPFLLPSVALLWFCCCGECCQCGTKRNGHLRWLYLHNHHAALCFTLRVIFLKPHCDMCGPYTFMLQIFSSLTLVTHVQFV